jgi:nucleotide-binding universal stress UspA family protein
LKKRQTKNFRIAKTKIRKILVPIDGSKNSRKSFNTTINLAKFTKSKIIGLHVMPTDVSALSIFELTKPLSSTQSIGYEEKLKKKGKKLLMPQVFAANKIRLIFLQK